MPRILGTLVMLAALAGGRWAMAQGEEARPGPQRGREPEPDGGMALREALLNRILNNPETAAGIGLSAEQLNTLKEAMFAARETEIRLRADVELLGLEQAKLMMKDEVDEDAVMKVVDEKWKLKSELAKIPIRLLLLVKRTLTAEQRTRIEKIMRLRIHEHAEAERKQKDGAWRSEGRFRRPAGEGDRERGTRQPNREGEPAAPEGAER